MEELNKAVKNNDTKKAMAVLDKGLVSVQHVEESTGHTALHRAAAFGAVEVIKMLHSRGASLAAKNKREQTPLEVAVTIGEDKAAKLLRALAEGKSGEDIDGSDDSGDES